ncbi:hypothetical protein C8R47DRAFT_1234534 [Mycena vitilis]|nr:hypothetical protein C8R47DRAFT_1234534 [Mycena vitilis]
MDNPIIKKIVGFLSTELSPLTPGKNHVAHKDTRKPILYDYHMPPRLQLQSLRYDPETSPRLTKHFVDNLAKRETIKNRSMNVDRLDMLVYYGSKMLKDIIYKVVSEGSVKHVQLKLHSIAAEDEEEMSDTGVPLDSPEGNIHVATDLDLREAIDGLVALVEEYDEKAAEAAGKTLKKRTHEECEDANPSDSEDTDDDSIPTEFLQYEEILKDAMENAEDELDLPRSVTEGLLRWVANAAYILIQIWGQMVRHNGTLAHFTCHNLALIMTRHRKTRSMGVSKLLKHTEAPLLRAAALTVYAYADAGARYDEHHAAKRPLWTEDPFHGETKEAIKAEKKLNRFKKQKTSAADQDEDGSTDDEDDDDDDGPSGSRRRGGGGGGAGGAGGSGGGGSGSGGGKGDQGRGKRMEERQKRKEEQEKKDQEKRDRQKDSLDLDGLHLAFKTNKNHLWSTGFSHLKRLPPMTAAARHSARKLQMKDAGERTSSVPTSPATTTSFTDELSRDNSFSEKSLSHQVASSSVTIRNAGILLHEVLGESAVGIVWSGKLIPEDGSDEDSSITIAVKMAVPRGNANSEAEEDEREIIRQEGLVYDFLAKSGKQEFDITPRYYGVFEDDIGTVALVLDNGGEALKTFNSLTSEQTQKLFAKAVEMHTAGVYHDDLVPRNIVQDSKGELRIIDFHIAKMRHRCHGKEKCNELLKLSNALGL